MDQVYKNATVIIIAGRSSDSTLDFLGDSESDTLNPACPIPFCRLAVLIMSVFAISRHQEPSQLIREPGAFKDLFLADAA